MHTQCYCMVWRRPGQRVSINSTRQQAKTRLQNFRSIKSHASTADATRSNQSGSIHLLVCIHRRNNIYIINIKKHLQRPHIRNTYTPKDYKCMNRNVFLFTGRRSPHAITRQIKTVAQYSISNMLQHCYASRSNGYTRTHRMKTCIKYTWPTFSVWLICVCLINEWSSQTILQLFCALNVFNLTSDKVMPTPIGMRIERMVKKCCLKPLRIY